MLGRTVVRGTLAMLLGVVVVLAGCGGSDDGASEQGARRSRKAGLELQLTICVTNNTSGTIQGTPALYASKGEGEFRAEPAQRVCVDSAPNYTVIDQRVLSAVGGPAWSMKLSGTQFMGTGYRISVGMKSSENKPMNVDVVCGGNDYRFSGTVTSDRDAGTMLAEYTFADR